jgi:hypothetical protein
MNLRLVQNSLPPPVEHRKKLDEDTGRLLDYVVEHKEGLTRTDAAALWGWQQRRFQKIVQHFRMLFANDSPALICERDPNNGRGPWVYRLSLDTRTWHAERFLNVESQLESMEYVARSALKGLDGRTQLGKWERRVYRDLTRMVEDIADLREQQAM